MVKYAAVISHSGGITADVLFFLIFWEDDIMAVLRKATADKQLCVACGACVKKCPKKAIEIISGCFAEVNHDLCVGCGICAKTCPCGCISVGDKNEK